MVFVAKSAAAAAVLGGHLLMAPNASAANPTCTSGATPCFELLGGVPGGVPRNAGEPLSVPAAISADGKVVVGTAVSSGKLDTPFRWVNGTMTDLGKIPDAAHGTCPSITCGAATGVNSDGSVVAGYGFVFELDSQTDSAGRAWVWSGGAVTPFDMAAVCNPRHGRDGSIAAAVSANGSVIVGRYSCDFGTGHAFRAINGIMTDLGLLDGWQTAASVVNADGSVIAGTANITCCSKAVRWTGGGAVSLGFLPGDTQSTVTAISGDGTVIFGTSACCTAVRWVNGVISTTGAGGAITGVNTDGTVAVGGGRWSATGGYRADFAALLRGWGLSFPNDQVLSAVSVSADGITIAGSISGGGVTPQGFIARLPLEPHAPAAGAATGIGGHFFTAKWAAAASATGYRVDVATDSHFVHPLSGYSDADVGNVRSIKISGLKPGTHYYYRVRAYNPTGPGANSSTITTTTLQTHATTLAASASPSSAKPGQSVLLKAIVSGSSGTPTGTVTFKEGAKTLGSHALSSGQTTLSLAALTIGTHTITAAYGGDDVFLASSGGTTVTVSASLRSEASVNKDFTAGAQQFPAVATLTTGYVVVWSSNLQDGHGYGVYGQRYTATGARSGAELHLSSETSGNQSTPKVAGLTTGGFVAVWQSDKQDSNTSGIYAKMFIGKKATPAAEFKVNTTSTGAQTQPAIATLSDGGFVIVWTSFGQDGDGLGVYGQRYDEKGKPLGGEFRVNTTIGGDQSTPAIAATTDGGFVVVWQAPDANGLGIFGQRYNSSGKPAGKQFTVNKATAKDQSLPTAAALSEGAFVVAWQSDAQDGSGLDVYAQRFTAQGLKIGRPVQVNTFMNGDQWQPQASAYTDGGFVVLWTSNGQDGSGKGVYAQVFIDTAVRNNGEFRINTTTANDQWQAAVAATSDGRFMAAWTSRNQDGSLEGVFSALFGVPEAASDNLAKKHGRVPPAAE